MLFQTKKATKNGMNADDGNGNAESSSSYTWLDVIKRCYIFILALAGITFSILVVYSCQFFAYRSLDGEPWKDMMPPFDTLAQASVGLFSYSEQTDSVGIFDREACIEYSNPFETGQNDLWTVALYCAIGAPVAGFVALAQLLLENCFCRLYCSNVWIALLFLAACVLQGCTFMVFADGEFCFNAASQNQCRLTSGAFFSLASVVSYLILAVLCTSLDAYSGIRTRCCCFIMTKEWRRNRGVGSTHGAEPIESLKNQNDDDMELGETSNSSGEGGIQGADDDFGESNKAIHSNLSSIKWQISEDSSNNLGQNSSTTNQDSDHPIASASLDSTRETAGNGDDVDDVVLNRNDIAGDYRQPDLLDMCCAGDPLQVEKHLEFPQVKLRKSKARQES